mgnify:CR=1 FL=1
MWTCGNNSKKHSGLKVLNTGSILDPSTSSTVLEVHALPIETWCKEINDIRQKLLSNEETKPETSAAENPDMDPDNGAVSSTHRV